MVDSMRVRGHETSFELETSPLLKWGTLVCFTLGAAVVLLSVARPLGVAFVLAVVSLVTIVVLGARGLFSSATINDAGIQIRNLRHPEVAATWGEVQEIQITWRWASCRVIFTDGAQCWIWACISPMTWGALLDTQKWLAKYDSPLPVKSQRLRQVTFCHAPPSSSNNS